MEKNYYQEMKSCIDDMIKTSTLQEKDIFLFGNCEASNQIIQYLEMKGYKVSGILDNNINKQGSRCMMIRIYPPTYVLEFITEETVVLIASRAYEEMRNQLIQIGYTGKIIKVVDYNTFAEYSISEKVYEKKYKRMQRGLAILNRIKEENGKKFLFICPYNALGDVYYAMAYLPYFLRNQGIKRYSVVVVGNTCGQVAQMFTREKINILSQIEMDELVQAILYIEDKRSLIVHHDRPYTNDMTRFIDIGKLTFNEMYCCGIYRLKPETKMYRPNYLKEFTGIGKLRKGKTVIISPYAKSVIRIPEIYWSKFINSYIKDGFDVYTNIAGDEKPLANTSAISIPIREMISAVEYAGYFLGVRSGLCDVISTAHCDKTVVFPNVYYSTTQTKVSDFFRLEGWNSINVRLD